jgi:beta-mannosidase
MEQYGYQPRTFEDFIDKSQELQALALHMAISAHLDAEPHCMGSLLWQLNDCWPGPSWSIIDYYGRKKAAYETVSKNFGR